MKTKKLDSYTRTMGDFEVIEPNDEAEFHSDKTELEGKQEYNFQFELENEFFDGQSAEEYVDGDGENDVYVTLAQKEKDLLLAAELGKALLEKNEELSQKYERLQEDYSQQAEELEQEKHELRLKLERIGGSHESRVHELQTDIQSLRNELRSLKTASLTDSAHKRKTFAELTEENEKLHSELYQLQNSHEALSDELNTIKRQQLSRSFSIDDINNRQIELQELAEKVARLEEGKNYLKQNVEELVSTRDGLTKDIVELQGKNQELQKKYDDVKKQFEDTEAKLDESKSDNLYLQDQLDEWKIQASLDQTSRGSLFSELSDMSISLDNIDGLSPKVARRDQTKESGHHLRPVQSLHGTPRPLAASSSLCLGSLSSNKRPRQYSSVDSDEEDSDDSDLEYDESEVDVEVEGIVTRNVDFYAQLEHEQKTNAQLKREIIDAHNELRASYERLRRCREGPTIKIEPLDPSEEFESGSLTSFVQIFKDVLDDIVKTQQKIALTRKNSGYAGSMVGSISDNLKEQIRQLKEDLYEAYKEMEHLREEAVTTRSRMKQKECDFTALNEKLEDRADEIKHLKEERKRLVLKECDPNLAFDIVYQQAIEDKEEALRRECEIALELEKTKRDAARLDKQLMEAIQQKIELSEQLEEWQYDMASLIEEQVQKQMRKSTSEQEEARSRKAGLFSKGWNWSSSPKRQNVL